LEDLLPESGFCWKKGLSRHHISEDQEIPETYQKIIFYQKTEEARRRSREEPQGRLTHRGRGLTPGHAGLLCGHPGPILPSPLRVFHHPRKPRSRGGGSEIDTAAFAGRKKPEREKLSGMQKSAGEIPSRRGKIIAIVIIIALDFIGIIITIILITSIFISTITTPSRYNILS
jgi:hypothetical protein